MHAAAFLIGFYQGLRRAGGFIKIADKLREFRCRQRLKCFYCVDSCAIIFAAERFYQRPDGFGIMTCAEYIEDFSQQGMVFFHIMRTQHPKTGIRQ